VSDRPNGDSTEDKMSTRWPIFGGTFYPLVGSIVYFTVVAIIDLYVLPDISLPILYAAPVLIMSFTESVLLVVGVATLATGFILISLRTGQDTLQWWPFALVSFWAICFLAVQAASQRAFIRRNLEEAARIRWNELLLSSVSHELRTPLTVILGYTQYLGRNVNLPWGLRGPVASIERSARQMRGTVDVLAVKWKRGEHE
jgi:signal transduction histidine kinase